MLFISLAFLNFDKLLAQKECEKPARTGLQLACKLLARLFSACFSNKSATPYEKYSTVLAGEKLNFNLNQSIY